ncbi:MAG TPA: hypothetical protein VFE33_25320 [Thermoanaerobaculia bacterium]|nr:hypothetical protein [Thermoanaerobaculia bacterium]
MGLALLVGWSLLKPAGREALSPAGLGLALVFGTTLLVGIGFPLARLGAPVTASTIAGLAGLLAAGLFLLGRRRPPLRLAVDAPGDRLSKLAGLLLLAGLALFLAKLRLAPLWTWDHFAVWGIKSRRMIQDGALDLGFLDVRSFWGIEPQYPLGLPFAWRLLSLGAVPGELAFKVCHGLFALALVAITHHGLLLASGSRRIANGLAAWLAVSPVLWDTVGVGHADLPLALWAVAALVLVFAAIAVPAGERGKASLRLAGLAAGFLPWIKQEGLVVALALLAASALLVGRSPRDRRVVWQDRLALLLPAAVTLAASRLVTNVPRAHGINFFAGRWWVRVASRLAHPGELLGLAAKDLLAADWLGIWIVFAVVCVLTVTWRRSRRPRRGPAAILCGIVAGLLAVYVSIYFVTVLPARPHLEGSFFRLLCPLAPLALLALAAFLGDIASGAAQAAPTPPAAPQEMEGGGGQA